MCVVTYEYVNIMFLGMGMTSNFIITDTIELDDEYVNYKKKELKNIISKKIKQNVTEIISIEKDVL